MRLGFSPREYFGWDTNYLRRLGFSPKTVVDVGAGGGSPNIWNFTLYESFPDAYHVLVEPLSEFEPRIRMLLKRFKGQYVPAAIGAKEETKLIHVEPRFNERSSFFLRTAMEETGDQLQDREVQVTTLDVLMKKYQLQPPFGLKIDTEGFEDQVILGGSQFLENTQFVIAEVAVTNRFYGGYNFADFIALMDRTGFCVCDILEVGRADTGEVTFLDLVFKKK